MCIMDAYVCKTTVFCHLRFALVPQWKVTCGQVMALLERLVTSHTSLGSDGKSREGEHGT